MYSMPMLCEFSLGFLLWILCSLPVCCWFPLLGSLSLVFVLLVNFFFLILNPRPVILNWVFSFYPLKWLFLLWILNSLPVSVVPFLNSGFVFFVLWMNFLLLNSLLSVWLLSLPSTGFSFFWVPNSLPTCVFFPNWGFCLCMPFFFGTGCLMSDSGFQGIIINAHLGLQHVVQLICPLWFPIYIMRSLIIINSSCSGGS